MAHRNGDRPYSEGSHGPPRPPLRMTPPPSLPPVSPILAHWLQHGRDLVVIVTDPAGVVLEWLCAAERILGYAPHEAIGQDIAIIFTPEDRARGYPEYELKVAV